MQGYVEYSVIRKKHKRAKKNSGGISVFVAEFLNKYVTRLKSRSENLLWLHINLKKSKGRFNIILGTIYVSPEGSTMHNEENLFQTLMDELIQFRVTYNDDRVIILGDFNGYTSCENDFLDNNLDRWDFFQEGCYVANLPKRCNKDVREVNKQGRELLNFCINSSMCIANGRVGMDKNIGDFTCYYGMPSTIDYMLTDYDVLNCISDFHVCNRLESHHLPITCTVDVSADLGSREEIFAKCDLKRFRMKEGMEQTFLERFQSCNVQEIDRFISNDDFEGAVKHLNQCIIQSAGDLGENRIRNRKWNLHEPWFNDSCLVLKEACINMLRKFRSCRNTETLSELKEAKKHYRNVYKQQKHDYKEKERADLIRTLKSQDSREFWQIVRKHTQTKVEGGNVPLPEWATYFRTLFKKPSTVVTYNIELGEQVHNIILDREINLQDVTKAIDSLRSGKAPGYEGISAEFFKLLKPYIGGHLVNIFNALFKNAYFPEIWTKSLIVPLPKKGDLTKPTNYRGISLLPIFSKIYTHILKQRLVKWCEVEGKICKEQAGFRKKLQYN